MKYLLLFTTLIFAGELEVDGDLKVTGTIQASTIDSLLSLIAQLEIRIAQLECQNTGIIPDGYCDCFFHTLDECGVCNGDTTSCQDCAGIPNGDNLQDMCGTCDNDSSNDCVQDCNGEWGGVAEYDVCGDCGGDAIAGDACGFALSFDGYDDYVDIPSPGSLTNFSYLGWFKTVGINEDLHPQPIINTQNGSIRIDSDLGNILFSQFVDRDGTPPGYSLDVESVVIQDQWHHFAYTVTPTGSKLYFDGVLVDETEESFSFNGTYSQAKIGFHGENSSSYFYGLIDEISIWSIALTPSEAELYYTTSPTGAEQGLFGYWNFDEGIGYTLYDSSPNGNHGTLMNMDEPVWIEQ